MRALGQVIDVPGFADLRFPAAPAVILPSWADGDPFALIEREDVLPWEELGLPVALVGFDADWQPRVPILFMSGRMDNG